MLYIITDYNKLSKNIFIVIVGYSAPYKKLFTIFYYMELVVYMTVILSVMYKKIDYLRFF